MRILKLRFQNLNSLQGEWEIDFRHTAYADEGIFAITGSTGAGKSTILDAICLALYGATPRLGEITQSKNDLMSRHTGECRSEVIFATKNGSYRCTWLQKRARKNPEGNLQSPMHEIAPFTDDATKLPPLETQTRKTRKLVAEFTGMDFDRFTRAMLLAQGSFAAFLQANSDERSNLLEEITGTEIYGDISRKVHEFKTQSDAELKTLTDRLSGMTVLSDEEIQSLTSQKNALVDIVNQTKTAMTKIESDKLWRQNLDAYTHQIHKLEHEARDLAEQESQFAPQKTRLQRALKALEVSGDIKKLDYQRDLLSAQLSELASYEHQLPTAEHNYQLAQKNQNERQAQAQQTETDWQQAQPLLNQVRKLDTTLGQKNQYAQEIAQQLSQLSEQLAHNAQSIDSQQQQLVSQQVEREQLIQAQQQIPHATTLPQTLASLTQLQETSQTLSEQLQVLVSQQQQLQGDFQHNEQQASAIKSQLTQLQSQIFQHRQNLESQTSQLHHLTQGQSAAALRQQVETYWQTDQQLAAIQSDVQTWQTNLQHYQQFVQQLADGQTQLAQIASQRLTSEQQQQAAEQTVELLNRNLILLAKIQDLTEERDKLRHGEPCPLCGSTAHPFATHQPYTPDDTEQQLAIAKQRLDNINRQLQQLLLEEHALTNSQQQRNEHLQHLQAHNQRLLNQLQLASQHLIHAKPVQQAIEALPSVTTPNADDDIAHQVLQTLTTTIQTEKTNNQQSLVALQESLMQIEAVQSEQQQTQQRLATLTEQYHDVLQQQTMLQNQQQHRQDKIRDIDAQQLVIADKQHQVIQRIDKLLLPFATREHTFSFDTTQDVNAQLNQHIDTLSQLLQRYQGLETKLSHINDTITGIEQALTRLSADQQHLTQNQHQVRQRQQALAQEISELQAQRYALFGEQAVDIVSHALIQAKNQALQDYQASQTAFHEQLSQLQILQQQIASLTTSTTQLKTAQQTLQADIQQRFATLGFVDDADYRAAVLVDTERERLQQLANQLHDSQQRNHNLLSEAKRIQQQLLNHPQTALSLEQLLDALGQLQQQFSEQQKQLGAVEQQLAANEALKQNQQQLLDAINQQRNHTEEWKVLHQLIGSSDGKKFRNFAQGLTFNIMVAHANEQLKKMSDRYLLIADSEQPLMLNVMDNYQGGQIRTSKNLSGGESFIISLSLALGLSNMASHRMQVDSLFLDEGFGTLDEEALDVALDTLTNLQQSGKLIGVISHIQALKDRISSQIQVVPQTGGISKIIGAGITKIS
ncbi:SbcC/MukB-like Walker B domain-containing protein [Moraxella osloensis]|uniref:SbcC/MukB-like Walker B domain-containing protein n=1 Tax=Faucicola osloensis TaxID=34062 RepID=UPI00242B9A4F|nr:SbcC/MukB-like Walker B domain-containing protein [Moraxella osloensis]